MLPAPTAPDHRLPRIVERARGFVYSVGLLGVTGERDTLAETATALAERLKAVTDTPVFVGVGVSNAEQADTAVNVADGVIQGSSMGRRLGVGARRVGRYVAEVRAAIGAVCRRLSPDGGVLMNEESPSRRRRAVETIHAVTYFSAESIRAAQEVGFKGFWMGYFGLRSAPPRVQPAVVGCSTISC